MSTLFGHGLRRFRALAVAGSALGLVALAPVPRSAGQVAGLLAEPVIQVEEDWQLVLNEPDGNVDSPQFHTAMSPYAGMSSIFAQVLWNYRETPDFTPGGVQLQSYNGETLIRRRSMEYGQLSSSAETITWTQRLQTDGAILSFEVVDGQSTTWGSFGKDMRIDEDAGLASLGEYSPDTSASESCVTYGSNRVNSMMITQVRYYGASGLLWVDATPRVVFQLSESAGGN